jgi:hypothetical protein
VLEGEAAGVAPGAGGSGRRRLFGRSFVAGGSEETGGVVAAGVVTGFVGGGVIRGGMVRRGASCGTDGGAVSLLASAGVMAGKGGRGVRLGRRTGGTVTVGLTTGVVAISGVAAGAGVVTGVADGSEGGVRRGMAGVCTGRG